MIGIALLGGLIAFLGLMSGLTLGATNAIQQIYAALLIISGVLGLVILAVAVSAAEVRNAIRAATKAAADDRRQLFFMLRDATFTVKSAAQVDAPQGEWVEVERGEGAGEGEGRSTPLAGTLISNPESEYSEPLNSNKQTTFIIALVTISVFVGIIILYLCMRK